MKARYFLTAAALAVAACTQPAPVVPPVAQSPSPSPAASPSTAPVASPSASVAPTSPAPGASTPAGTGLGEGEALKPYGFNWIGGLFRDPARDQIYVIDAQNKTDTPRRYLLRKFQADGTFMSTIGLTPENGEVPDAIDAFAFDQRGIPFFSYREDETFRLMKLITAAVVPVAGQDHPLSSLDRAGPTTITPAGAEMLVAAVSLVKDEDVPEGKEELKGGNLTVGRAEEGESPTLLFTMPDPLWPAVRMVFGPDGNLYLTGPNRENQIAVVRVKPDQTVSTLTTGLPAVPDRMVVSPTGDLVLGFDSSTAAAKVRFFGANGEAKGEADLALKDSGYITTVQGLVFDAEGRLLVAGRGFNGARETITGLYRFGRPTL